MAVTDLRNALLSVSADTYHYKAPQQKKPPYIVWGETSISHAEDADDRAQILLVSGELWYYTNEEYDQVVHEIMDALDEAEAAWRVSSIGRDNTTGMIVYGFAWSLPCGNGEIY